MLPALSPDSAYALPTCTDAYTSSTTHNAFSFHLHEDTSCIIYEQSAASTKRSDERKRVPRNAPRKHRIPFQLFLLERHWFSLFSQHRVVMLRNLFFPLFFLSLLFANFCCNYFCWNVIRGVIFAELTNSAKEINICISVPRETIHTYNNTTYVRFFLINANRKCYRIRFEYLEKQCLQPGRTFIWILRVRGIHWLVLQLVLAEFQQERNGVPAIIWRCGHVRVFRGTWCLRDIRGH